MRYKSQAVPFAIAVNLGIGLLRLLEPSNRYLSAGYASAKAAMPIRWWGVVFIVGAVVLWAMDHFKWELYVRIIACLAGFLVWGLWAFLSGASAYNSGHGELCSPSHMTATCHLATSYGGVVLYGYVAATHVLIAFRRAPLDRRTVGRTLSDGPGTAGARRRKTDGQW